MYFAPCFSVSIVNFGHVNAGWVTDNSISIINLESVLPEMSNGEQTTLGRIQGALGFTDMNLNLRIGPELKKLAKTS